MALDMHRVDGMVDPLEIVAVDILLGAERALVERALGALGGDSALGAIVGRSVGIAFEEILPDFGPDLLEAEADIGKDRIVAPQAMLGLQDVPDADRRRQQAQTKQRDKQSSKRDQQTKDQNSRQACYDRHITHRPLPLLYFVSDADPSRDLPDGSATTPTLHRKTVCSPNDKRVSSGGRLLRPGCRLHGGFVATSPSGWGKL